MLLERNAAFFRITAHSSSRNTPESRNPAHAPNGNAPESRNPAHFPSGNRTRWRRLVPGIVRQQVAVVVDGFRGDGPKEVVAVLGDVQLVGGRRGLSQIVAISGRALPRRPTICSDNRTGAGPVPYNKPRRTRSAGCRLIVRRGRVWGAGDRGANRVRATGVSGRNSRRCPRRATRQRCPAWLRRAVRRRCRARQQRRGWR